MDPLTHQALKLMISNDRFYLVPTGTGSKEALEIDRLNFDISLIDKSSVPIGRDTVTRDICALIGIIHLIAGCGYHDPDMLESVFPIITIRAAFYYHGPYLIVATDKSLVGSIDGHAVYNITNFDVIPFSKSTIHLSDVQERDNQTYLSMIKRVLATPGFYYSNTYDLTHSLQRKHHLLQTKPQFNQLSLFERADERFVWNAYLLRDFVVQPELRRFIVPMILGFVSISAVEINSKRFSFILISRRSALRAGVRYFIRGVDDDGHVANYIETEQMMVYCDYRASFVQTRGSIPLYWSQRPTLKYKPRPRIDPTGRQIIAMRKHLDEQIVNYGQQVVINLVDQKGSEKKLGEVFQSTVAALGSCLVDYCGFDFHKECSKLRWHRLSILLDQLTAKQEEFGYFMMDPDGSVMSVQQGVFRTNCIDCLDRTNVVQSMLGRRSLSLQLQCSKILSTNEPIESKYSFEKKFKNVWADNADFCANQYTGTGALKTDFTRTGKRTLLGALKDGYNSAIRYYYNNFQDGYRQDSIDLFLGNFIIDQWERNTQSPLYVQRSWRFKVFPVVLLIGISMLFLTLLLPTNSGFQLLYVLFWAGAVAATLISICQNGPEFVDNPRLMQRLKST